LLCADPEAGAARRLARGIARRMARGIGLAEH